uniref:Pellino FHA domain-containing protein n=1 Tax=Sphenodon punctatus TaxID=8508 RepID=A0A8D0GTJ3_SPHPU
MVLEGSPEAVSSQSLDLRRACPKGARIFPSAGDSLLLGKEPVKYGELIVLGYNGSLPNGDKGRRRSRLALFKRPKANGVKPGIIHHISTPLVSKVSASLPRHWGHPGLTSPGRWGLGGLQVREGEMRPLPGGGGSNQAPGTVFRSGGERWEGACLCDWRGQGWP